MAALAIFVVLAVLLHCFLRPILWIVLAALIWGAL
jgi:hypothetical protein